MRRGPARLAVVATTLAALARAHADGGPSFELKGFFASEYVVADDATYAPLAPLLPPAPGSRGFFEVNAQPRLRRGPLGAAADVSLFLGTRAPRHLVLLNEGYASAQVESSLLVLLGRRRLIWGSGLAANPMDPVNPQKNFLDPEQQRTGAFLLPLVEVATEEVTLSAFFSPRVATFASALPERLDFDKGIAAARVYTLLGSTDVNLMLWRDLARARTNLGASLSRFLGESVEIHAELRLWSGLPEPPPIPILPVCSAPVRGEQRVRAAGIAGLRHDWADQTTLSLEYLYLGTGLSAEGFAALRDALPCQAAAAAGQPPPEPEDPLGHPVEPALTLLRRHYLVAIFRRPHLDDARLADLALGATLLVGPADRSVVAQVRLGYRVVEQGTVALTILVADSNANRGEINLWPTRVMVLFDARISY